MVAATADGKLSSTAGFLVYALVMGVLLHSEPQSDSNLVISVLLRLLSG